MFLLMKACFAWLPLELYIVVSVVFAMFILCVMISIIRIVVSIVNFLHSLLGGLLTKVVDFFV